MALPQKHYMCACVIFEPENFNAICINMNLGDFVLEEKKYDSNRLILEKVSNEYLHAGR